MTSERKADPESLVGLINSIERDDPHFPLLKIQRLWANAGNRVDVLLIFNLSSDSSLGDLIRTIRERKGFYNDSSDAQVVTLPRTVKLPVDRLRECWKDLGFRETARGSFGLGQTTGFTSFVGPLEKG